jgi:hypothetical protein
MSLTDAIIGVVTTVGIAVVFAVAITLAGLVYRRPTARVPHAVQNAGPAQQPTQTDDLRELVLR